MNKKLIKVDLSNFFEDERRMTYLLIDSSWKTIACLQRRVEYLFDVESVRFLSDGAFLPTQETIEILQFFKDLKAFAPKESLEKRKNKKSKKNKNKEKSSEESSNEDNANNHQQHNDDSQIKRKYSSLGNSSSSCSTSNQAKRSKGLNTFSEISSTSEQILPTNNGNKKSKSKISRSIVTPDYEEPKLQNESNELKAVNTEPNSSPALEEDVTEESGTESLTKKRHTSTPKQKNSLAMDIISEGKILNKATKTTASLPSSTFLSESKMQEQQSNKNLETNLPMSNNPFRKPKSIRPHIYFNDSGEIINPSKNSNPKGTPRKECKTIVIFRCSLSDLANETQTQKPRIFPLKIKNSLNNINKKNIIEIQEEIILPPLKKCNEENSIEKSLETSNENKESDPLNDISSVNDTTNATTSTTIAKIPNTNETDTNILEVTHIEDNNVTQPQNETQIELSKTNETSNSSLDCVDLSIDIDDYEEEVGKNKSLNKLRRTKLKNQYSTKDEADYELSSDCEEISEIIDLNETEDNSNFSKNISSHRPNKIDDITVKKILPFSTDTKDLPNVGDIIVFKANYLNKQKRFVKTDYMAGKVEYINKRMKSIKFLIIDGLPELRHLPDRFICNLDDSQNIVKYMQIKLNEISEPKLFSMS